MNPEWRSAHPTKISKHIITALVLVLASAGAPPSHEGSLGAVDDLIRRLVNETFTWQQLIRQHYLFTDLEPVFPSSYHSMHTAHDLLGNPLFDSETMEDQDTEARSSVLGAFSFGLVQLPEKSGDGAKAVLLKSEVWTDQSQAVKGDSTPKAEAAANVGDAELV